MALIEAWIPPLKDDGVHTRYNLSSMILLLISFLLFKYLNPSKLSCFMKECLTWL